MATSDKAPKIPFNALCTLGSLLAGAVRDKQISADVAEARLFSIVKTPLTPLLPPSMRGPK